ncbi:MAG TPA: 3-oxoacyl-[acyl-carrier-protein] synthase III C-terminal domain-containing protein, partial [Tepidisphaeraceae bacterium]|nr:3-oxoacyl-[acyl-carrier-protein] synthase III C-terminal domain-containing protein [Tepidisphaeraceae bacterium]
LDDDPGVLISACLFGDAAGALVLSRESDSKRCIHWKAHESLLDPKTRDSLRFDQRNGMLRNILTPQVPALAASHAKTVFDRVLHQTNLNRRDIAAWILHAGGRDVLLALRETLALAESDVAWSADALRELGNVSSPFVIHVLARALAGGVPDGYWYMSSFGAGFSCHGALLEVTSRP